MCDGGGGGRRDISNILKAKCVIRGPYILQRMMALGDLQRKP